MTEESESKPNNEMSETEENVEGGEENIEKEDGKMKEDTEIKNIKAELAEKETIIEELENEIEQKENVIEDKDSVISDLKNNNKELKKAITKRNNIIEQQKQKKERNEENLEREMIEDFVGDIGRIRQSINLALENADEDCNVSSGLETTIDKMDNILENYDVKVISPKEGNKFNPDIHEAVGTEKVEDLDSGLVVETYKQGFVYEGTVIESAKVIISD